VTVSERGCLQRVWSGAGVGREEGTASVTEGLAQSGGLRTDSITAFCLFSSWQSLGYLCVDRKGKRRPLRVSALCVQLAFPVPRARRWTSVLPAEA
jgi:hypothetical protein